MKKTVLLVAAFIIITVISIISINKNNLPEVCINKECFKVEVVKTPQERAQGLMNRESLEKNTGMLFIFESENIYPFWMKNTLIPLDIIWIDSNKKIVHIGSNVPPCKSDPCPSYNPNKAAIYVLEINTGLSNKQGFKEGDEVKININS